MINADKNFTVPEISIQGKRTFTNPLGTEGHPDPCIVYCEKEKCYYGISTTNSSHWGGVSLLLHRSAKFEEMFVTSESTLVYQSNDKDETYGPLWAPELHYIKGHWYIYTSCQHSKEDTRKHLIVLKAKTDSPFDGFEFGGHINRDCFAIDPTIYQDTQNDKLYLCCSPVVGTIQMLSIQELASPTEPVGEAVIIAKPELDWELVPPYVEGSAIVEGAYFVKSPGGRLFILYSANGCWSDDYVIGLLEYKGGDILSADSWEKYPHPILTKGNGNYGPGHATFFYSPDKSELWICHHCLESSNPSVQPMKRLCHCQRVFFDETGFPHIGPLAPNGVPFAIPAE